MEELFGIENNLRQELANIKTQHRGEIYHYTSAEGLEGIIDSGTIWFSDIEFLNDSSETTYAYEMVQHLLPDTNFPSNFKTLVSGLCAFFSKTDFCMYKDTLIWKKKCYVASFSKDKDCLALWNYYTKTDNGVGYNFGINVNKTFENNSEIMLINGEVIYEPKKQKELLANILDVYNTYYQKHVAKNEDNVDKKIAVSLLGILEFYNLFLKSKAYEVEKEYRLVIYDKDDEIQRHCKYRIKNDCFIPYYELPLRVDSIETIYVSPAKEQKMLIRGVELLIQHSAFSSANVKGSEIPKRY